MSPRFARPFTLVGGRTSTAGARLAVETIVRTTPKGESVEPTLALERRDIVRLCRTPQSVVEVAARLRLPFGAVRVLIGDLCSAGCLVVHSESTGDDGPDDQVLEKVLDALRSR